MNPQEAIKDIQSCISHNKSYEQGWSIGGYSIPSNDALNLALYALTRLIPVRPFEDGEGGYICNTVNCNTYLDKFAPYCPMCGKPICWEEGEKV
jgi:hypothetical protein